MLYGYGTLILQGTLMTLALTVLSAFFSTLLGIVGALCKTSGNSALRYIAAAYTTVIRSIPDLVIMLLVFYNLQIFINWVCDMLGIGLIEINAFTAGVVTLAFIYGAYMTETFRGALESVPRGQIEAALSTGMSDSQVFRKITLPQMIRFALPGFSNNIQVVIKSTALVSIIGLVDIISISQQAGRSTQHLFFFNILAALIYLAFTCATLLALARVGKRFGVGVKEAQL
ncbi:ABC transporter permease subunit [Paralcaligenes sp. KSB-10]|uniref:ABC transporter permease n=1 Tax=Paralcaligenes sp. KSB-10 TaxID=2901142 RepID=UPI001E48C864|nr:ABC transporter permease subunit [Paralcaligenes sp. KSB-10]UHL65432.1 ABC transporter permease subunit [Paralcaligenes sp. KSB-10]